MHRNFLDWPKKPVFYYLHIRQYKSIVKNLNTGLWNRTGFGSRPKIHYFGHFWYYIIFMYLDWGEWLLSCHERNFRLISYEWQGKDNSFVNSWPPCFRIVLYLNADLHCYKTDGEIPVHTHDDARRQRSRTGKYFPYGSGINTCLAPAVFNTSGIFPGYAAWKKGKERAQAGIEPTILGTTRRYLSSDPLLPCVRREKLTFKYFKSLF